MHKWMEEVKLNKMQQIKITFPDGNSEEYEQGITAYEIAEKISPRLAKEAIAAKINGNLVDLSHQINKDAQIQIITFKDKEGIEVFRHSSAHLLAHAVTKLFPDVKLTIGPVVEEGFYYDMDSDRPFTPEDLINIEKEMANIVKEDLPIYREQISHSEAALLFKNNTYKLEMISELADNKELLTIYKQGDFFDLCRGPHVPRTSRIKAFKLTKVAGAYWRADANNKQLQRIYGISFPEKKLLDAQLKLIEEAEKRDHRKLGRELDLFSFHEEAPGMPFFHPKGMVIWNELMTLWREEHKKAGYVETKTPIILNKKLWLQSGHWDHYRENMYFTKIDNVDFALKPMNCPGGMLVYRSKVHSYKELPLRMGEVGLVHRHELSGVLSGLFRVRCLHQDDAHLFVTKEQLKDEIKGVVSLTDRFYKLFGLTYHVELSTRPEKAMGDPELWTLAENTLEQSLKELNINFKINAGDGAFYGPKIDFHIKDAIGRTWQCATCQLDFQMPERFDLNYEGQDGKKHRPVMLHRVIYGAIERFFGILTEHFAGKFPLWLSPVHVKLLPIADRHLEYCKKLAMKFDEQNIRIEIDERTESVAKKIRDAQLEKIPLMITIGDKEIENGTLAVRTLDGKVKFGVKTDEFISKIIEQIKNKSLSLEI